MSTAARHKVEPLIESVEVTDSTISVRLQDGRHVSVPLSWFYRLELASPAERANYRISVSGRYVHWPDIDEDLSAQGFLTGTPAPRGIAYRKFIRARKAVVRESLRSSKRKA